jgi:RHH-type proline utilization regulon transcriptional repressor/proline dehydrogenase/delta 1-pyrroline-5-carboxylate dehydrogenase
VSLTTAADAPAGEPQQAVAELQRLTEPWAATIELLAESHEELAEAIRCGQVERVRYAARSRVPEIARRAAAETGLPIADGPVLAVGRIELLHYLREQSLCIDYHRYGNLGARADDPRAPVA